MEEKYIPRELSPKELVHKYALEFQVSESEMTAIISCESSWNTNEEYKTLREDSWGLVQINLLAWHEITKEQATDPKFAVEFLAKNLSLGNHNMWFTCYHKYKSANRDK